MTARWRDIAADIGSATGHKFDVLKTEAAGGGCINEAVILVGAHKRYFVKLNRAACLEMFAAEAEGLSALHGSGTVRVPEPVCRGVALDRAFLVLEYIELEPGTPRSQAKLGEQLAAMHGVTQTRFGWHRDNTIGSTPQSNTESDDWIGFWGVQRLQWQLDLAARGGRGGALQRSGEQLLTCLPSFFAGYSPPASLLHGDLWGGNWAADDQEAPVIFDPAVYYGDRETDIAMTELFGGFGDAFYSAYQSVWPLDPGFTVRKTLYNLYHVLNHLNLFGGGYGRQAESMMQRLLAECR